MADDEQKIISLFMLSAQESVLIQKFHCTYKSDKFPARGSLYILNHNLCFASMLNSTTLFGHGTRIKLLYEDMRKV